MLWVLGFVALFMIATIISMAYGIRLAMKRAKDGKVPLQK